MLQRGHVVNYIIILFTFITIAIIAANRDLYAVGDTLNYKNFFENITLNSFQYEYLFSFLTYLISIFTANYIIYFFILNLLLNVLLIISTFKISRYYNLKRQAYIPLFLCSILISSWYFTVAFNGLRQGLALSMLYISVSNLLFFNKRYTALTQYLLSCFFHYSNILLLPLVLLMKFKIRTVFIITTIIGVMYVFNINEELVRYFSELFNITLYDQIKYYSTESESYHYGFNTYLFIYTIGLSFIYQAINVLILKNKINNIIKIYLILTIPYYIFGFAGYSNRYGLIAWLFTVFINPLILYELFKKNFFYFSILFTLAHFISIIYFMLRFF